RTGPVPAYRSDRWWLLDAVRRRPLLVSAVACGRVATAPGIDCREVVGHSSATDGAAGSRLPIGALRVVGTAALAVLVLPPLGRLRERRDGRPCDVRCDGPSIDRVIAASRVRGVVIGA